MRYDEPQIQILMSAEYVLGLLIPPVRRRFARLMTQKPELRAQVAAWESRLAPMYGELTPVEPPARVWRGIDAMLDLEPTLSIAAPVAGNRLWQAMAAALAVVSLALGVLLLQPAPVAPDSYLAVFTNDQGNPLWLVETTPDTGELRIQAIGDAAPPSGRDHELWLLPGGDEAPISLGLLPAAGSLSARLPPSATGRVPAAAALAVSLEPAGGSPTGAPTGPVLFVASLIKT